MCHVYYTPKQQVRRDQRKGCAKHIKKDLIEKIQIITADSRKEGGEACQPVKNKFVYKFNYYLQKCYKKESCNA